MRMLCMVMLLTLFSAAHAAAQLPRVEVEAGGGYVFGGGAEDPGPSLGTCDLAVAVWPLRSWGVVYRLVRGPGDDLYDPPIEGGDRLFLGFGDLRYSTITARYRRPAPKSTLAEFGFGLLFGGRFADLVYIRGIERQVEADIMFDGFALEAFVGRRVTQYFGVKGGVTFDFNFETTNVQPVLLASFGF